MKIKILRKDFNDRMNELISAVNQYIRLQKIKSINDVVERGFDKK